MSESRPSAIVQAAYCSERVVVLTIRIPGRSAEVIVGCARTLSDGVPSTQTKQASQAGVGLLARGVRKDVWGGRSPPGEVTQKERESALRLAHVLSVVDDAIYLIARSRHGDSENQNQVAEEEFDKIPGCVQCLRVQGGRVVLVDAALPANARAFLDVLADPTECARLEGQGNALAQALSRDALERRRDELCRILDKACHRIERRRKAILEDLANIDRADARAAQAQWLIVEASRVPRGTSSLKGTDWSSGEPLEVEIPLDPRLSAREQIEALFKRAKRLKVGGRIGQERLEQANKQATLIASTKNEIRRATSLGAMVAFAQEAKQGAPRDVSLSPSVTDVVPTAAGRKTEIPKRVAFRTFLARSGMKIFVGKGAQDNDTLTLTMAKPNDLWLHAKARTGAHVVVPLQKGRTCPAEDLVDAAHLAAHFSDARDERAVDILYTPKRYVRKPKGSAPGAVVALREKVLPLRFDPALIQKLLEREDL